MATSAIGPGFLTQTTVFTNQLLASFGFVILVSVLLDIGVQLSIWRVLAMSEKRAPEVANALMPGLGYVLALLIVFGGFAFNIANAGGSGLGVNVLTGVSAEVGAIISGIIAIIIFWVKEFGKALDGFTKLLGIIMIALTAYVAVSAQPPLSEVVYRSLVPEHIDFTAMVTLVGGTVGGYISFAGAHRLLDAGIKGDEHLKEVNRSAVSGIIITGVMRMVLFLAVLGVVVGGAVLDTKNPAASVFFHATGTIGYKIFGVVLWCASITSIIGCAYTSVSFLRSIHPFFEKYQPHTITVFIAISVVVFVVIGNPVRLLVSAGAINGFILPASLAIILIASGKSAIVGRYRHPLWMQLAGWLVVVIMGVMSLMVVRNFL
jgi:Mn2+/Fe2+ NRAMP family transporter